MNRNRLPRAVNTIIDRIADSPTSIVGRFAARRYGKPTPGTPATTFADKPVRVLIAPVNYSGQGYAWARALEAADASISARNMAIDVPGGFSFTADVVVPVPSYHNDEDWQRREFQAAAAATHVLIEAEEPPFGRLLGRSVQAQFEALRDRGVDVAFLAHGTDVRLPSRHVRENPWSHYRDPGIYTPRHEALARRNIELLESSGRPLFVSTPDLLADLPTASWCPVVVDVARWTAPRERRRGPLRVVHVPSVSAIKGTELIVPTLERLAAAGVIEFTLVQGVPSSQMPAVFAAADVVVDQMRIGSYGVAACEAMASGCLVLGHVTPDVRATVTAHTGLELPVVEADPDTLETVIRELADADLSSLREQGDAFVRTVHDGRLAAEVLLTKWIFSGDGGQTEGEHASFG